MLTLLAYFVTVRQLFEEFQNGRMAARQSTGRKE